MCLCVFAGLLRADTLCARACRGRMELHRKEARDAGLTQVCARGDAR